MPAHESIKLMRRHIIVTVPMPLITDEPSIDKLWSTMHRTAKFQNMCSTQHGRKKQSKYWKLHAYCMSMSHVKQNHIYFRHKIYHYIRRHDMMQRLATWRTANSVKGAPLKKCNSLRNWAVAFFMLGRGNEKATVLFSAACVSNHNLK